MTVRENAVSLLDTAGCTTAEWYLWYKDTEVTRWWSRFLKPGFEHVQAFKEVRYGPYMMDRFWLVVAPTVEHVYTYIDHNPIAPWDRSEGGVFQYVTSLPKLDKIRSGFFIGPITCVELIKAYLGVSSFFIRTPWQLYKYIRKKNNVLR